MSKETHNPFSDCFGFKNPILDFFKETHPKFLFRLLKRLVDSFLITWREIIEETWRTMRRDQDHETIFIPSLDLFKTGFGNMTSTNARIFKLIEVPLKLNLNLFSFFYLHKFAFMEP